MHYHVMMHPVGFVSHYQLGKRSANAGTTRMSTTTTIKPFVNYTCSFALHHTPRLANDTTNTPTDGRHAARAPRPIAFTATTPTTRARCERVFIGFVFVIRV